MMEEMTLRGIRNRLRIAYAISFVSTGLAVAALLRDPIADAGIRRNEDRGGISLGDNTFGTEGLFVYGRGPSRSTARVTADHVAAAISLSNGANTLDLVAWSREHGVSLMARGKVTSELRVDTTTGAWSIVQHGGHKDSDVIVPLAPPMGK